MIAFTPGVFRIDSICALKRNSLATVETSSEKVFTGSIAHYLVSHESHLITSDNFLHSKYEKRLFSSREQLLLNENRLPMNYVIHHTLRHLEGENLNFSSVSFE